MSFPKACWTCCTASSSLVFHWSLHLSEWYFRISTGSEMKPSLVLMCSVGFLSFLTNLWSHPLPSLRLSSILSSRDFLASALARLHWAFAIFFASAASASVTSRLKPKGHITMWSHLSASRDSFANDGFSGLLVS